VSYLRDGLFEGNPRLRRLDMERENVKRAI